VRVCKQYIVMSSFEFLSEVLWRELMHMHVTIFSSTSKGITIVREINTMNRSEMTSNFS